MRETKHSARLIAIMFISSMASASQSSLARAQIATPGFRARKTVLYQSIGAVPSDVAAKPGEAETILDLRAHHVTLSVADINLERDWYRDKLGFAPGKHTEHGSELEVWQLNIPGYRMDLVRATGSQRPKAQTPDYLQQGLAHIAFTAADLAKALSFLKLKQTDVTPAFDDHKSMTKLTVHDPEGNQIEIFPR